MIATAGAAALPAALGGEGWAPRLGAHGDERGAVWAACGVSSDCGRLRSVLLHRPGAELAVDDHRAALWLARPDPARAREEHDRLAELYRGHGVAVHYVGGAPSGYPNLYFLRDSFAMTPQGAILARPAARARAGEERVVAAALAGLGIPILLSVHGGGTFEGADLLMIREGLALLAESGRTNEAGALQVRRLLRGLGVAEVVRVRLGACLHLDCALSLVDRDLALVDPRHLPAAALRALRRHGVRALSIPPDEADAGMAINCVALEPGLVVLPAGNPATAALLRRAGVTVIELPVGELMKGAGAIHCMTGVLLRDGL